MTHNHLISITHHQSQSLAQHYAPWLKTTGPAKCAIIHNHWLISFITNCSAWHTITQTQSAQYKTTWFTTVRFSIAHMIRQWLWIMVCYAESVVVNHDVLYWDSGCEWWWAMLSQWLLIMMCYTEPVGVIRGVLCCAKGCESWRVILNQWLWIMMCYAEPVVVNHGVLYWASGCQSWCAMLDSQLLAHYNSLWFTTTGSA
jgi:hypothetical protein